jgi:outer membrane murein-binding lipoprotein Lpp
MDDFSSGARRTTSNGKSRHHDGEAHDDAPKSALQELQARHDSLQWDLERVRQAMLTAQSEILEAHRANVERDHLIDELQRQVFELRMLVARLRGRRLATRESIPPHGRIDT